MQADETTFVEGTEAENQADVEENVPETVVIEAQAEGAADTVEGESEADPEAPPSLEEQLAAAQAEAEDYKDRWLRSQAEFANARKRMEKQRVDLYAMATADVMKKLLPALDDYERAMTTMPEEISEHSWVEGIQLVRRKLQTILENFNVTTIEAVGETFDPNFHEAISQEPSDDYESGVVCRELQKGYKIGERVIRPSLVTVVE